MFLVSKVTTLPYTSGCPGNKGLCMVDFTKSQLWLNSSLRPKSWIWDAVCVLLGHCHCKHLLAFSMNCYFLEEGETCQNVGSLLRCVQCFWGRIFTSATPSVTNQEWLTDGSTELYQCCCTELQSKEEYLFSRIFLSLQSLEICWCMWHCIVLSGWNSWCFVYFSTKHNIHSTPHAWFHKCELFSLWH